MGVALAHDKLLLYQSLWVRWTVSLLLSAVLGHISVGTRKEIGFSLLKFVLIALRRQKLF